MRRGRRKEERRRKGRRNEEEGAEEGRPTHFKTLPFEVTHYTTLTTDNVPEEY